MMNSASLSGESELETYKKNLLHFVYIRTVILTFSRQVTHIVWLKIESAE